MGWSGLDTNTNSLSGYCSGLVRELGFRVGSGLGFFGFWWAHPSSGLTALERAGLFFYKYILFFLFNVIDT